MAYGKRDGFSYADDVPIKVLDGIKIPPLLVGPINIQSHSLNFLNHVYDFSLERQVIELDDMRWRLKEEALQRTKLSEKSAPEHSSETEISTVPITWIGDQILSPQPLDYIQPQVKNMSGLKGSLNLSDFESQSSSPFDFIELQTINDLEELNTVFQGLPISRTQAVRDQSNCDQQLNPMVENEGLMEPGNTINQQIKSEKDIPETFGISSFEVQPDSIPQRKSLNQGSLYNVPSVSEYTQPMHNSSISPKSGIESTQVIYAARNNNSDSCHPATKTVPYLENPINSCEQPVEIFDPVLRLKEYSGQKPGSWQHLEQFSQEKRFHGPVLPYSGFLPRLRSSKSTSDITVDKVETQPWRSQTPPPSIQRSNDVCREMGPELPDPYSELGTEDQEFVHSLVDMGFAKDRAARAVKHLGNDHKKVLDHLCQVQGLEDGGYTGADAETALHLYDYNVQEAKKYLELLIQFQDLGFEKCDVRKALIRHKNDRDKTLDFLLS